MVNRSSNFLRKRRLLASFLCLSFFVFPVYKVESQSGVIAGKYLKIIPGVSTRDDVEREFPQLKSEKFKGRHSVRFRVNQTEIWIEYSPEKCGNYSVPDWGRFPEWTVIDVLYSWPDGDQFL